MRPADPIPLPSYAYIPGETPRHPDSFFAVFHASVDAGMTAEDLSETLSWHAAWLFLQKGYNWEAHEVLEPIWMALPDGSREKIFVQALIQLANAALKLAMHRANASLRLCVIVEQLLSECAGPDGVMGRSRQAVLARLDQVRQQANLLRSNQGNAL